MKDHTDLPPKFADIGRRIIDILAVIAYAAGDFDITHQVVHTVQRFQQGGFSAAGRADQGRDTFFRNAHIDIAQRLMAAIPQAQLLYGNDIAHSSFFLLKWFDTRSAVRFRSSVISIRMAAIANATPNSPSSLA